MKSDQTDKKFDPFFYNTRELAEFFGVSNIEVSRLVRDGILSYDIPLRFDVRKAGKAYIHYLRKRKHDDSSNASAAKTEAEVLKLREQAQREIIKNEQIKGTLAKVADIDEAVTTMLVAFRNRMLAIPTRIGRLVLGKTDLKDVIRIIKAAVDEALAELHAVDWEQVREQDKELRKFATSQKSFTADDSAEGNDD